MNQSAPVSWSSGRREWREQVEGIPGRHLAPPRAASPAALLVRQGVHHLDEKVVALRRGRGRGKGMSEGSECPASFPRMPLLGCRSSLTHLPCPCRRSSQPASQTHSFPCITAYCPHLRLHELELLVEPGRQQRASRAHRDGAVAQLRLLRATPPLTQVCRRQGAGRCAALVQLQVPAQASASWGRWPPFADTYAATRANPRKPSTAHRRSRARRGPAGTRSRTAGQ